MQLRWVGVQTKPPQVKMKIFLFILVFFILSALLIVSNNNLAMSKQESYKKFFELYIGWLDNIYDNTQKISGEAVKMNWLPPKN